MGETTDVAIVGAGPVGLALAADLAGRGLEVTVYERRTAMADKHPTANHLGVRAMEMLRRMGLADRLQHQCFDEDYGDDRIWVTGVDGRELYRIKRPANRAPDDSEHSPTREIWCPKEHLDPMLEACARDNGATIHHDTAVTALRDVDDESVRVTYVGGTIDARHVIGCDGTNSTVRRLRDIGMSFHAEIPVTLQSTYFRAPDLIDRLPRGGTQYVILNAGMLIAIDGRERWRIHFPSFEDAWTYERAAEELSRVFGEDLDTEILSVIPWKLGSSIASQWRDGRVVLAGDAAHQVTPYGGLGMNYGLLDAEALAWRLAAIHRGWGSGALLDDYAYERTMAITKLLSYQGVDFTVDPPSMTTKLIATPAQPEIDDVGPAGEAARAAFAVAAARDNEGHFDNPGVDLDQRYEGSPGVVPDGTPVPPWAVRTYEPDARPGHRAPHVALADGSSVIDAVGETFVLASQTGSDATGLGAIASAAAVPLRQLPCRLSDDKTVLIRPDGVVAWRGPTEALSADECRRVIAAITGRGR